MLCPPSQVGQASVTVRVLVSCATTVWSTETVVGSTDEDEAEAVMVETTVWVTTEARAEELLVEEDGAMVELLPMPGSTTTVLVTVCVGAADVEAKDPDATEAEEPEVAKEPEGAEELDVANDPLERADEEVAKEPEEAAEPE